MEDGGGVEATKDVIVYQPRMLPPLGNEDDRNKPEIRERRDGMEQEYHDMAKAGFLRKIYAHKRGVLEIRCGADLL